MAIHLSNNNITQEREYYYEVLDVFAIAEEDVFHINRSMVNTHRVHPSQSKKYEVVDIDYDHDLKHYFKMGSHSVKQEYLDSALSTKLYKDHLILTKEFKVQEQYKAINQAQVFYGLGRQRDAGAIQFAHDGGGERPTESLDHFVVTRSLNQ